MTTTVFLSAYAVGMTGNSPRGAEATKEEAKGLYLPYGEDKLR
jgi:hypothetical protein